MKWHIDLQKGTQSTQMGRGRSNLPLSDVVFDTLDSNKEKCFYSKRALFCDASKKGIANNKNQP